MHPNLQGIFGGVQHVPGLGYVQAGPGGAASGRTGLGDDGTVMMISGVKGLGTSPQPPPGQLPTYTGARSAPIPLTRPATMGDQLAQQVTLFNVTLPMWTWLLLAAALGGVAGRFTK